MPEYSIREDYERISSLLEKAPWGTFPFHGGNFWHSGIHLQTNGEKIKPILNGKVVAYRIRDKDKEVELSESLTEVEYNTLDEDLKPYYESSHDILSNVVLKLKEKGSAPRKKVSDSFILLKHEIKRCDDPFVFYTLYMNLAGVPDSEREHYPWLGDNLNATEICIPELDQISYIPNGFRNDGEEYIEFVLFSETKLGDFLGSCKKGGKVELFKSIPTTEQLLMGKKKEMTSTEKFLIPKESDYIKKQEYLNGENRAVEIELKSYNGLVKIVDGNGGRTLWWLAASDYYEDGIQRDFSRPYKEGVTQAEGLEYIIELLKNGEFVAKCEDASSIYITTAEGDSMPEGRTNIVFSEVGIEKNPTFWTLETLPFKGDVGKEGKAECHGPYIVVEVYRENPLQLEFWEILEEQHHVGLEIRERTIYRGVLCGQEVECYKAVAGESEYYVRKDVAECYLADAYDFSEWFIDLTEKPGRSKGIICDKKNVYEGLELKEELERVIQGNYTQGDFKILLGYDNSSAELRRIRGALRSVVCRHPLEWDESQFASESLAEDYRMVNRQTAVLSRAQARNLRKAAADIDIWRGGLERVFGRNEFNFYHPLYFLHYLDKAGFLEFNPYAGKRIVPHHPNVQDFSKQQHPDHVNQVVEVKFNPGFVPAIKKTKATTKEAKIRFPKRFSYGEWNCADVSWEYHCPWYAAETVGANGELIPHTGIDLYGHVGDGESVPIIALVRGRIWAMTTSKGDYEQSYGRVMLIKGDNDYLYLLGHLENFNDAHGKQHKVGDLVSHGDVVAYAGTTGNSSGKHLHLEVIECKTGMDDESKKKVLDISYNKLHENDGGAKGETRAILKFTTKDDSIWEAEKSEDWKNHRLNPLTGEKK